MADFLLDQGAKAAPMSAQEIAEAAGTSDATVVRTARSLGYANLRELRDSLAGPGDDVDLADRLRATIAGRPAPHDVLADAVDRQLQGLSSLLRRVPAADFDRAAGLLAGAGRIWWSGIGPSASLAEYAAFCCRRHGRPAGSITHAGTDLADELLSIAGGDAVVVLAYGRIHPHVRVLLQRAAGLGVPVVLVTDTLERADGEPISVRLSPGRGAPGVFATHGSTVVLIEALVLALAAADPARSAASLEELNSLRRALAGRRLDVDPGGRR